MAIPQNQIMKTFEDRIYNDLGFILNTSINKAIHDFKKEIEHYLLGVATEFRTEVNPSKHPGKTYNITVKIPEIEILHRNTI